MVSSFVVVTRAAVPSERLFDVSLSIDAHVASMATSGERAIGGVTAGSLGRLAERLVLVPYLRRLIRRRNAHLVAWLTQPPDRP